MKSAKFEFILHTVGFMFLILIPTPTALLPNFPFLSEQFLPEILNEIALQ